MHFYQFMKNIQKENESSAATTQFGFVPKYMALFCLQITSYIVKYSPKNWKNLLKSLKKCFIIAKSIQL